MTARMVDDLTGGGLEGRHSGRVAWGETDASGRIHHTVALRWAEIAEHDLFRKLNPSFPAADFPRKDVRTTFHVPLAFDDPFDVRLRVASVGTTSLTLAWDVTSRGTTCIDGQIVIVQVGPDGRPVPLSTWIVDALRRETAG